MKNFGKSFKENQIKQWKEKYIDYDNFKLTINDMKERISGIEKGTLIISDEDLGPQSIRPSTLLPLENDNINKRAQDLTNLYKQKYGLDLKSFIEELDREFRKVYLFFVTTEKELYKNINNHIYSKSHYWDHKLIDLSNEIGNVCSTLYLTKSLNLYVTENINALKKILDKFDKNFNKYFGIIAHKYIMTHLTSQNSDLEYILQFKIIEESCTICESCLNELKLYYTRNGGSSHKFTDKYKRGIELLRAIEETTYYRIQFREWFYYIKENNKLVKNNPLLYENDIFNPILSSAYHKDSILEKCLLSKFALKDLEKSMSPISHSNKTNIILIYIHTFILNVLETGSYIIIFLNCKDKIKYKFYMFYIIISLGYITGLLSLLIYRKIGKKYIKNLFLSFYILIFISSICLIVSFSIKKEIPKSIMLIASRILFGIDKDVLVGKYYITLLTPKHNLPKVSKTYLLLEKLGFLLGPIFSLLLLYIPDINFTILNYNKYTCIGWLGVISSIIMFVGFLVFFTEPDSKYFYMVINELYINASKFLMNEESNKNKEYRKEQKKLFKEKYESKQKGMNEILIQENNIENVSDPSVISSNPILTDKQKEMLNTVSNKLDEYNLISNFNNVNRIPDELIIIEKNEKKSLGYINFNLLFMFIILFVNSLLQENYILYFVNYIMNYFCYDEYGFFEKQNIPISCLLITLILIPKCFTILFIFPFYKTNYLFRSYILISFACSIVLMVLLSLSLFTSIFSSRIYIYIPLNFFTIFITYIIEISIANYLSFILPPNWKFFCIKASKIPIILINTGKLLGPFICLFDNLHNDLNMIIINGISIITFIVTGLFIYLNTNFSVKSISRILRKDEISKNGI